SLSQVIPLSGVVMVTTPQDVALLDVRKAVAMFQRLNVPIIGVVENMSVFACPHCGERTAIFGEAGGQRIADEYGVPLLARIPLDPETRAGGDSGVPITLRRPASPQAAAFRDLAAAVTRRLGGLAPLKSLPTIGCPGPWPIPRRPRPPRSSCRFFHCPKSRCFPTRSCRFTSSRRVIVRWSPTRSRAIADSP